MLLKVRKPVEERKILFNDTETTGLSPFMEDLPYAVGNFWGPLDNPEIKYYEWLVDPYTRKVAYVKGEVDELRDLINSFKSVCFHNSKFDLLMLEAMKVKRIGRVDDTSFAARICNTLEPSYSLKPLAYSHFDYPLEDIEHLKKSVLRMRLAARKKGWNLGEVLEQDYWLCQYAEELLPNATAEELEEIKAAVGIYCIGDVFRTALLWSKYEPMLAGDEYLKKTYERELELLPICCDMERRGISISRKRCREQRIYCMRKSRKHKKKLFEMVMAKGIPMGFTPGEGWTSDFNPSSPKQLSAIMYGPEPEGYGLECVKETKSGAGSTDWKAMRPHQEHPFVRELLLFRSADKAIDTFFGKYLDMMRPCPIANSKDVYALHPSFNQMGTLTGRFSSSNPNGQQISNPESSPRGTDIAARYPFGPRPGYTWYVADYAQMELRVFADIADVPGMLKTVFAGEDLNNYNTNLAWGGKNNPAALEAAAHALELGHDETTRKEISDVWDKYGWGPEKSKYGMRSTAALELADLWMSSFEYNIVSAEKSIVKSQSRQRGKTVMFCKMYGGGASAVTDLLFCSLGEATKFMRQFDVAFPEIVQFIEAISQQGKSDGYIITRYGRKLRVDSETSYRSSNYMVQGTCADLMKESIRRCSEFLKEIGIDGHILMTIHDELIFEIRKEHSYLWVLKELCRIMSDHEGRLRVPMPVKMQKCTERWDKKEEVLGLD